MLILYNQLKEFRVFEGKEIYTYRGKGIDDDDIRPCPRTFAFYGTFSFLSVYILGEHFIKSVREVLYLLIILCLIAFLYNSHLVTVQHTPNPNSLNFY